MQTQNSDRIFKRKRKQFSLNNFGDGYIDNKGRFRVWFPNHPRAYENGYVLRSIVAYELYHGVRVKRKQRVHHIDQDKLNDSKENLQLTSDSQHKKEHARLREQIVERVCEHCGETFEINSWRLRQTDTNRGRFCSQKCYHTHKRSEKHRQNISNGLKNAYAEGRR